MAYFEQVPALIFICISVLYDNRIEGTQFTKVEGIQTGAKVNRILNSEYVIWQTQIVQKLSVDKLS
jgi:hypothetical protein